MGAARSLFLFLLLAGCDEGPRQKVTCTCESVGGQPFRVEVGRVPPDAGPRPDGRPGPLPAERTP